MSQPSNEMNAEEAMNELCEVLHYTIVNQYWNARDNGDKEQMEELSRLTIRLSDARLTLTRAMRPVRTNPDDVPTLPKIHGSL